ncbi:hypothetical protein [Taklimakanibacter deserti]|uniref:hypothetical protein n=1 Tax=Taklimakanibacter deserti TaxID=2267839 RepID=UPI0013C52BD6
MTKAASGAMLTGGQTGQTTVTISTEALRVPCPLCGKAHKYLLEVERSKVVAYDYGDRSTQERSFVRLFICATTNSRFQAEVKLTENAGEKVRSVDVVSRSPRLKVKESKTRKKPNKKASPVDRRGKK